MTPSIGRHIQIDPLIRSTSTRLQEFTRAVEVCIGQGLKIGTPRYGHGVTTCAGGWRALALRDEPWVTPVGAVALAYQPPSNDDWDAAGAACSALECSRDLVRGVVDGWRNSIESVYACPPPDPRMYADGLRIGHVLFARHGVECSGCNQLMVGRCTRCDS